jgi:hypothetical protein
LVALDFEGSGDRHQGVDTLIYAAGLLTSKVIFFNWQNGFNQHAIRSTLAGYASAARDAINDGKHNEGQVSFGHLNILLQNDLPLDQLQNRQEDANAELEEWTNLSDDRYKNEPEIQATQESLNEAFTGISVWSLPTLKPGIEDDYKKEKRIALINLRKSTRTAIWEAIAKQVHEGKSSGAGMPLSNGQALADMMTSVIVPSLNDPNCSAQNVVDGFTHLQKDLGSRLVEQHVRNWHSSFLDTADGRPVNLCNFSQLDNAREQAISSLEGALKRKGMGAKIRGDVISELTTAIAEAHLHNLTTAVRIQGLNISANLAQARTEDSNFTRAQRSFWQNLESMLDIPKQLNTQVDQLWQDVVKQQTDRSKSLLPGVSDMGGTYRAEGRYASARELQDSSTGSCGNPFPRQKQWFNFSLIRPQPGQTYKSSAGLIQSTITQAMSRRVSVSSQLPSDLEQAVSAALNLTQQLNSHPANASQTCQIFARIQAAKFFAEEAEEKMHLHAKATAQLNATARQHFHNTIQLWRSQLSSIALALDTNISLEGCGGKTYWYPSKAVHVEFSTEHQSTTVSSNHRSIRELQSQLSTRATGRSPGAVPERSPGAV